MVNIVLVVYYASHYGYKHSHGVMEKLCTVTIVFYFSITWKNKLYQQTRVAQKHGEIHT